MTDRGARGVEVGVAVGGEGRRRGEREARRERESVREVERDGLKTERTAGRWKGSVVLVSLSLALEAARQALTNGGNKFRIKSWPGYFIRLLALARWQSEVRV